MTRNVCIYLLQHTLQQQSSSMNKTRMKPQLAAITEVGNQNVSHEFIFSKGYILERCGVYMGFIISKGT